MLLLIPERFRNCILRTRFTFHYASTYTGSHMKIVNIYNIYIPLCFYLYAFCSVWWKDEDDLHSTMLLLIRWITLRQIHQKPIYIPLCFYLYENYDSPAAGSSLYLHSTMLLLILHAISHKILITIFTFHYASTYTLSVFLRPSLYSEFTFHYASTYTKYKLDFSRFMRNLHSTMLLLIPSSSGISGSSFKIYIPLCFYLYEPIVADTQCQLHIYIPLCFYLYAVQRRTSWFRITFTFHYASTYTLLRMAAML